MTADDVVERIRKLLRLAESAGATEREAAAALEWANALLVRHNLRMDQAAGGPQPHAPGASAHVCGSPPQGRSRSASQ